jgi:DNA-binding transcriptional ArsR family regulator
VRRLIEVTDPQVARAIAHPLRREILSALGEQEASPSALAERLGHSVGRVSYHVNKLVELGLAELVRTAPRRGATEHFYRANGVTYFPGDALAALPESTRDALLASWWGKLSDDVARGISAGGWERPDAQALRASLTLDERGFRELGKAIEALHARALRIESRAQARLDRGAAPVAAIVALLLFERPTEAATRERQRSGGRGR